MTASSAMGNGLIEGLRQNAGLAIGVGIVMLIVGALAIASPFVTGVAITLMVGIWLVIGGAGHCLLAFRAGAFGRGLILFLVGLVTLIAGLYMFMQPVAGLASIALLLAAYFLVTGILAVIAALQIRPESGWGWMLANGVVTLLLGLLVWRQWPLSGAWAVGVLFGLQLMMTGATMATIGSAVRRATRGVGTR